MSRYIDADALHDALKAKQKWVVQCGDKHNEGYTYDQVHFAIDDAPSIDIVRCQDCKYWVHNFNGCARNPCTEPWYATDFCSYGKKERPMSKRIKEIIVRYDDKQSFIYGNTLGEVVGELVRCKECVEYDGDDWCVYWQNVINPDDFCSYGEREGE